MKNYTLYSFPALLGIPRQFRFKWCAVLWSMIFRFDLVSEIRNNQTGERWQL